MSTSWSLGVLVGLPVLIIVVAGLVVGGVLFWRGGRAVDDWEGDPFLKNAGLLSWGVALCVVGLALSPVGYYPYKAEYHQWRPVSGQVAEVSKRLVSSGDSMEEKIVVRFAGRSQEYGCTDTRCTLLKAGDGLDLKCKRAWQYASQSGYDCRFVARRAS